MAVVGRPELVFVDEPTAGMDPQARRTTWDLLEELRADGVTIVLTTHYMDEAERLADQVHVIDRGRLIASGSPGRAHPRAGGTAPSGWWSPSRSRPTAPASLQARPGRAAPTCSAVNAHSLLITGPGRRQHAGQGLRVVRGARRAAGVAVAGAAHARGRLPADHRAGAGA